MFGGTQNRISIKDIIQKIYYKRSNGSAPSATHRYNIIMGKMIIKNSFKVKKHNDLSLTDQVVYSLLSCYSDRNGVSDISRQKLADKAGIKDLETITNITNRLEKKGLIMKSYSFEGGKKLAHYQVCKPEEDFMWVRNSIFNRGLKPGQIGFFIKLAEMR